MSNLASEIIEKLVVWGWVLTSVESCTGGMVFSRLTDIAGASGVLDRGFITYSNQAKQDMVGVPQQLLEQFGAVSQEVASAMASGGLAQAGADIAVAISGIAGPSGGSANKPVGLVWIAVALRTGEIDSRSYHFTGNRQDIREAATIAAFQQILEYLV